MSRRSDLCSTASRRHIPSESAHEKLATDHLTTLAGLVPDTTYHYRIVSADRAGNQKVSRDLTFTTQAARAVSDPAPTPDPPAPIAQPAPTTAPAVDTTPRTSWAFRHEADRYNGRGHLDGR